MVFRSIKDNFLSLNFRTGDWGCRSTGVCGVPEFSFHALTTAGLIMKLIIVSLPISFLHMMEQSFCNLEIREMRYEDVVVFGLSKTPMTQRSYLLIMPSPELASSEFVLRMPIPYPFKGAGTCLHAVHPACSDTYNGSVLFLSKQLPDQVSKEEEGLVGIFRVRGNHWGLGTRPC